MFVLFAGVVNTGVNAAWLIAYLSTHRLWKEKIAGEVRKLLEKHSPTHEMTSSSPDILVSLSERLSKIPAAIWEEEMPIMDACTKETIRLTMNLVFLRQNFSRSAVDVGGYKVGPGEFVVYPSADVHHDPAVYEDPMR